MDAPAGECGVSAEARRPLLASFPPFAFLVAYALGVVAHRRWPASLRGGVARPLGLLLIAAGVALDACSLAVQFRHGTSPMPSGPTRALVTDGPYRHSRNPIYIAHALITAGTGLLVMKSAWSPSAGLAALVAIDRRVVPFEERELESAFGDDYRRYRHRVRRWL